MPKKVPLHGGATRAARRSSQPKPPGALFIHLPKDPCTGKPQFQSTDSYFEWERQRQFLQNPLMSQSCENREIQQKISLLAWHNLYDFKNDCAGSSFFHLVFVNDHCLFPYYWKKIYLNYITERFKEREFQMLLLCQC